MLFLANRFPQPRVFKWLKLFQAHGWKVVLFVCSLDSSNKTLEYDGEIYQFGSGNRLDMFPFSPRRYKKIREIIREKEMSPSLVFVRDIFQFYVGAKIAKTYEIPVVLDIADNYPEVMRQIFPSWQGQLFSKIFNAIEKRAVRKADRIVTVTKISADLIMRKHGIDQEKVLTVRNVPSFSTIHTITREADINDKSGDMVYIGTYSEKIRDLETVITAIPIIRKQFHDVHLHVFTFNVDKVKKLASHILGSEYHQYVDILPTIKNAELYRRLQLFKIGLIPHCRGPGTDYTEPNKLYDYIHSRLPVLASDNPTLVESVTRYKVGETYRSGDVESFVKAYAKLRKDHFKYVTRCKEVCDEFVWEKESEPLMVLLNRDYIRKETVG